MGQESKIQWTEATWNPWHGCRKVSAGCKFCYMFRDKEKYGQDPTIVTRSKTKFYDPLKWKDPRVIFTCSWSDWFIEEADAWRSEAWTVALTALWHTYQILTKRPERILANLPKNFESIYRHVWMGTSVEDQDAANKRIEHLLQVPAAIRFLSMEPLIGPVDICSVIRQHRFKTTGSFHSTFFGDQLNWVIIGGESGNDNGKWRYRECKLEWIQDIITQCKTAGVPVFVKQLGTHLAKELGLKDRHGGNIEEWPEHLRIRQMPDFTHPYNSYKYKS